MDDLILMLKGAMAAEGKVGLMMNVPKTTQDAVLALMPGHTPTLSGLSDPNWVDVMVILSEEEVRGLIPKLKRAGATSIVEFPLNKIID
jgi:ATP phosphoribosyltransferase